MAVADGMAMVHNFECSDGRLQSLPADNIEPCSCSMFARSVHYREKEASSARPPRSRRLIADACMIRIAISQAAFKAEPAQSRAKSCI
jgi:hypothetical protein